jgi:hypothetical protein
MRDLIEAFAIFSKYTNAAYPTCCEHDTLYVMVKPDDVSQEDKCRLQELGFNRSYEDGNFYSYTFGSC